MLLYSDHFPERTVMNISVIFPHPDDAVLNAGGTLARWATEGHNITAVCCTRGNMGTLRMDQTAEELGRIRSAELLAANKVLGITHTEILDFPDGCRMDPEALRRELVRCVRQYKPHRVVTMDPWVRYEVHRDHLLVGQMASEASAFACFPLFYPEQIKAGLEPHNASEVWYMGLLGRAPDTFVSIRNQLQAKVTALLKFEATLAILDQLMAEDRSASSGPEERAWQWIEQSARDFGKIAGLDAAEVFAVQKCAPGHFDNFAEIHRFMRGESAPAPVIFV
jgi:LmbE family N-acetylglucosaminyl deacetylase